MRRFVTADQHFGHANIIKYCNRPFSSVSEMDEALIDNWNKAVAKDDIVYVLGDFALAKIERIIEIGNRLHGNKKLILGNHDRSNESVYKRAGFSFVSRYPILIDNFIILSHAPLEFLNENCPFFNIHGHVHDDPAFVDMSKVSACVCVERTMYTPVDLEFLKGRYYGL